MSWHTDSRPGLLALLFSPGPQYHKACLEELRLDWEALAACVDKAKASLVLGKPALMGPRLPRPMSDLTALLRHEGQSMSAEHIEVAQRTLGAYFWLWPVEDS